MLVFVNVFLKISLIKWIRPQIEYFLKKYTPRSFLRGESGKSRYYCGYRKNQSSLSPMETRAKAVSILFYSTVYLMGVVRSWIKIEPGMPFFVP